MSGNSRDRPQPPEHRQPDGVASPWREGTGPGPDASVVLDQTFDGDSLFALRSAVAAHGSRMGMPQQRVYDFVTVVHELAANSVRHGGGQGRVLIWLDGDTLFCQVTDDGMPQRAGSGSRLDSPDPAPAISGHGLWLISQLAEEALLRISPFGTTASVCFSVEPPPQRPPC